MQTARQRIAGLLRAADIGATVTHAAEADLAKGPVVFVAGMSASVEGDRLSVSPSRWAWTWDLTLAVMSRRYHPTGDQAETEVAAIVDAVFAALAPAGRLQTAELPPLAGLEWLEIAGADLPNATLGETGGSDLWEAGAIVTVTAHTRSTA